MDEFKEYEIVEKRTETGEGKVYEYGTFREVGKSSFLSKLMFWGAVAASIAVGGLLFFFFLTVFLYFFLPVFLVLTVWTAVRSLFRR